MTNNPHNNKISYSQSNQRVPKKDDKYGNIDNFTTVRDLITEQKPSLYPKTIRSQNRGTLLTHNSIKIKTNKKTTENPNNRDRHWSKEASGDGRLACEDLGRPEESRMGMIQS